MEHRGIEERCSSSGRRHSCYKERLTTQYQGARPYFCSARVIACVRERERGRVSVKLADWRWWYLMAVQPSDSSWNDVVESSSGLFYIAIDWYRTAKRQANTVLLTFFVEIICSKNIFQVIKSCETLLRDQPFWYPLNRSMHGLVAGSSSVFVQDSNQAPDCVKRRKQNCWW